MNYFGYLRYLKIQLEDLKDYQRALSYIGKLDFYEVTCCICNFYVYFAL